MGCDNTEGGSVLSTRSPWTRTSTLCGPPLPKKMGAGNTQCQNANSQRAGKGREKLLALNYRSEHQWQKPQSMKACKNLPKHIHFNSEIKENKFGSIKVLNCWLEDLHVDGVLFSSPGSLGSKTEKLCVIKWKQYQLAVILQAVEWVNQWGKTVLILWQPLHVKIILKIS